VDRSVLFAKEAEEEITEAYFWYEEREPGLGDRFLQTLKHTIQQAVIGPDLYPTRFDQIRKISLPKFPHSIYFDYDEQAIYVLAVFHKSRHPSRLDRLRNS